MEHINTHFDSKSLEYVFQCYGPIAGTKHRSQVTSANHCCIDK